MPSSCCVPQCANKRGGHKFPNEAGLRKRWIVAVRRDKWSPTAASRVCHKHFTEEDYVTTTALDACDVGAEVEVGAKVEVLQKPPTTEVEVAYWKIGIPSGETPKAALPSNHMADNPSPPPPPPYSISSLPTVACPPQPPKGSVKRKFGSDTEAGSPISSSSSLCGQEAEQKKHVKALLNSGISRGSNDNTCIKQEAMSEAGAEWTAVWVKQEEEEIKVEVKEEAVEEEENRVFMSTTAHGDSRSSLSSQDLISPTQELEEELGAEEITVPPIEARKEVLPGAEKGMKEKEKTKQKRTYTIFTDAQEVDLGEWYRENPLFYDKGLKEFKDMAKKNRLYEEKAQSMNVTVQQLKAWIDGIRTLFGKLVEPKSGKGAEQDVSERDQWILQTFGFLEKHIVHVPSRQSAKFQHQSSIQPRSATPSNVSLETLDDEDDQHQLAEVRSAASSSHRKGRKRTCSPAELATTEDIITKVLTRVEESRDLQRKVVDSVTTRNTKTDEPFTAWNSYLQSQFNKIHLKLWQKYTAKSLTLLHEFIEESKKYDDPPPVTTASSSEGVPQMIPQHT